MADWLILDDKLKEEWEQVASAKVTAIAGRKISVTIVLPDENKAKDAYLRNENLMGKICWVDGQGHGLVAEEVLPFRGVFILENSGERFAQAAVWNSYLEKVEPSEADGIDIDDLGKRRLMTFPRQLLDSLCRRMEKTKGNIFDEDHWTNACVVPAKCWLLSRTSMLRRIKPNNASDLMSAICGVRRYVVSRDGAMGYSPEKRRNHPSYDGRICPVDTPESEMVGISLQLARGAWVDKDGLIHATTSGKVLDRISCGTSLIPFSHHNDGARNMMGAKNLRQATPVLGREMPVVKTGTERELAGKMKPLMNVGICPECTDGHGEIAMGRDLLVAYLPWNGWNLDDALVVNRKLVDDGVMSVVERKTFSRTIAPAYALDAIRSSGTALKCGDSVARFRKANGATFAITYNDDVEAKLTFVKFAAAGTTVDGLVARTLTYEIEKTIPLGRGDKLMARHGNKGVIGSVVPEAEMPRLPDDQRLPAEMRGRAVDILVNPHGVLSRMNPGQLLETHLGWLLKACKVGEKELLSPGADGNIGAPEVGQVDLKRVQDRLEASGLDRNGRIKLVLPDGTETENPVVVGYEHFVRLHHIPELKAQARMGDEHASYNAVTMQPAHGRKVGGGQRFGEMEVWALDAHGADHVLEEMLGGKSDRDWAAAWKRSGTLPSGKNAAGEDVLGFPHLLKDWLRALCIDLKIEGEVARFDFLTDAKALVEQIGEANRIESSETCKQMDSGRFQCLAKGKGRSCGWTISGTYPLSPASGKGRSGKGLKLDALLRTIGFDGTGKLEKRATGGYVVPLRREGRLDGELVVQLEGYNAGATTLNVVVSPSEENRPSFWVRDEDLQKIHLRAEPFANADEQKRYNLVGGKKKKFALKAKYLLEELQEEASGRSLCKDFSVVCPTHRQNMLRIVGPFEVSTIYAEKGLFDQDIFKGKDDWGYIQLPVEIEYPYWGATQNRRAADAVPESVKGVKLSVIPVLPLHYRRPSDRQILEVDQGDASHYYLKILRACQDFKPGEDVGKIRAAVADLFEMLGGRLEGKNGLLRHDGLGRRVDRSFRLVISPNPELGWDQVGVPTSVLWEMLGDQVLAAERSESKGGESSAGTATPSERPVIEQKAGWTWHRGRPVENAHPRMEAFLKDNSELVVLVNRQPSLHRDSVQAFHPVAIPPADGETLQLSPLCCEGLAADFDGDEASGHLPVSEMAQSDARKLLPSGNVRSVATGISLAHLDRDLVTGLELIHRNPDKYAEALNQVGLDEKAAALLHDDQLAPGEFGQAIFKYWCEECPKDACTKISAISRVAFRACTTEGLSFGFFDLMDAVVAPRDPDRPIEEWEVRGDDSPFAVMVNSGANGAKQIRQVVHGRGQLETGKDLPPVDLGDVSLVQGMDWKSYFDASQNARYSMSQKKIGTQSAGALTRKLVLGMWDWTICGSPCQCEESERSVANCRCHEVKGHEHQICAACFKTLPNGREPEPGMRIGLIAAQTLGERGTQLSMRVFHAGSAEVDIATVAKAMTGTEPVDSDVNGFVEKMRKGAYAKIDRRYFELLWRVLQSSPNKKLSGDESDPFKALAKGNQMKVIRKYAEEGRTCNLNSPFARVWLNLFGDRAEQDESED